MAPPPQLSVAVAEPSDVAAVRRAAAAVAVEAGADETGAGRIALAATELASNILKHAGQGEILVRPLRAGEASRIELLSIDRGPGRDDIERCLVDGYSTAGSSGTGLGAVRRLSAEFDLYSVAGRGTVVMARVDCRNTRAMAAPLSTAVGVVSRPLHPEEPCGDAWLVLEEDGRLAAMVVDGLGHGPLAAVAAGEALQAFSAQPFATPATRVLDQAHRRMAGTRGGAVAVAQVDRAAGGLGYAAVGNIAGSLLSGGQSRGLLTHHGIVGSQMRTIKQMDYPCPPGSLLILHSDGLQQRWSLADHPGLAQRHPAVIAAWLYRDFRRRSDDVTVLVVAIPS